MKMWFLRGLIAVIILCAPFVPWRELYNYDPCDYQLCCTTGPPGPLGPEGPNDSDYILNEFDPLGPAKQ